MAAAEEDTEEAIGVGTRVIVFGTLVMIPGFWLTWGAQIPARYERAACSSVGLLAHAETQSWTFFVKAVFVQTQSVSALSLHCVRANQVFMHLGRTEGADGAGTSDEEAAFEEVVEGAMHLVQMVEVVVLRTVDTL